MIRKLLLPALLVGLLGGCVTGYGYHDGYYYGQPSVEYRYRDYGYPYGYYGYYPYRYYGASPYSHYRYYNYGYYPYYRHGYPYYYNRDHRDHRKPRPPVTGTPMPQPPPPTDTRDDGDHRPPLWREREYTRRPRTQEIEGGVREPRRRMREVPSGVREAAGGLRAQAPRPMSAEPVIHQAPRREARDDGPRPKQIQQRGQGRRRTSNASEQEP